MTGAAPTHSRRVHRLAGALVFSVLYDAVPNRWFDAELERLRLPRGIRPLLAGTKGAAVAGLLVGLRSATVGRLTARALVAYFVLAVGAHARVKDKPFQYLPALAMLASSAMATRSFPTPP